MGCQVYCGDFSVNYSRGAWLVEKMCRPWFDQVRDTDSDGWYQDSIASTSLIAANENVPFNWEDFKIWAKFHKIELDEKTTEEDFLQCREFLTNAAATGASAGLSH